jgi:hypothetical protein
MQRFVFPLAPVPRTSTSGAHRLQCRNGQGSPEHSSSSPEISRRVEKMVQKTLAWAEVNHHPLTSEQTQALRHGFQQQLNQTQTNVLTNLHRHTQISAQHPQFKTLQTALKSEIQGSPALGKWVKGLLLVEYVPSTLIMLAVSRSMYTRMQENRQISPEENDLLMRQEYARQAVGFALHVGRTLLGFESVVWAMAALKRHQAVRHWAKHMDNGHGFKKPLAKALHTTADWMHKGWNMLYSDTNQTIASLGSLMLMNVLTYGITRPLMVNATFMGINRTHPSNKDTSSSPPPHSPYLPQAEKTAKPHYHRANAARVPSPSLTPDAGSQAAPLHEGYSAAIPVPALPPLWAYKSHPVEA